MVFYEDTDNGSNTITLSAPSAITSSITLTLPDGDGDANQVLKTDGSGNLSWVAQTGGVSLTNDTNNYITTATGSNSVNGEANLTFDGSTLGVTGDVNIVDSLELALTVQNSSDASSNQVAIFQSGNRATPADNDEGYVSFYNDDSTGTQVEFSRMSWKATDVTNDSKDSQIEFDVMVGDTLTQTVIISSGGIDLPTSGDGYSIEGTSVLNATTLGFNVVTSSLTTVGTLNSGAISSGFGNIDIGSSSLDAGAITGTGLTLTGDIDLTGQATDIDLVDNNSSALSFDTSGKTGILNIVTTNSSEGVSMSGTLDVTGLSSLDGGIDVNGSNFAVNTSGQVTAGEWTGTTISVANGGTGATSLTSNAILTGNGSSAITAEGNLLFDGSDLTLYEATNDGNPSISIGSASAETLLIQSVYDSGASNSR